MKELSVDEKSRLIELVIDEFGNGLAFDDFAAVVHGHFDDIPGLEIMRADEANHLISILWSEYHD